MTPERHAELRELARGWVRFLRFIERCRREETGEPVVRLVVDDAA